MERNSAHERLILASSSPRRLELLKQIGLQPEVRPSFVKEVMTSSRPDQVVMDLSQQKAGDVAVCYPGADVIVIGADTVVSADGLILGKPQDREDAIRMLKLLQGRTHQVYTGVTLTACKNDDSVTFSECTEVTVFPMSEEEIKNYVNTGEPFGKAGAYAIQGYFAAYIREIHGEYSNVVGLPVGRVWQELKKLNQ